MEFIEDTSNWPVVTFKIKGNFSKCSRKSLDEFLLKWSELYVKASEEKTKFRVLIDVSEVEGTNITYTLEFGKFLKNCKELTEMWMIKTALVMDGGLIKGILDFIFSSVYKPVRPFKVFDKLEDAAVWILNNDLGDEVNYK